MTVGSRASSFVKAIAAEPPFRLFARALVKRLRTSARTRAFWDVAERPHYLLGVLTAADQAKQFGMDRVAVVEFGVAGGAGLLLMERYAEQVEDETGIGVQVYGFDSGRGLPPLSRDYRDHPELWIEGDYPMDEGRLRARLGARSQLILGNIATTVPEFVRRREAAPIGFVAVDVDLYTSARDALAILHRADRSIVPRAVLYFDDTETILFHRFAGELLAINEFNEESASVKIDRWRGLKNGRPFPLERWLDRMYIAYDLEAMNRFSARGRAVEIIDMDNVSGQVSG